MNSLTPFSFENHSVRAFNIDSDFESFFRAANRELF